MSSQDQSNILRELLKELDGRHPEYFKVWKSKAVVLLAEIFGDNHVAVLELKNIRVSNIFIFDAFINYGAAQNAINIIDGCIKILETPIQNRQNKNPIIFISYSIVNSRIAAEFKRFLQKDYNISPFLAHEDINVSKEWRDTILKELMKANVFIALLDQNFKDSEWFSQELGIAISRDMLIIPIVMDKKTIPYGFANIIQGEFWQRDGSYNFIIKPLLSKFPILLNYLIKDLRKAGSFRNAEYLMSILIEYKKELSNIQINNIIQNINECKNDQVVYATLCAERYIPELLALNKHDVNSKHYKEMSTKLK